MEINKYTIEHFQKSDITQKHKLCVC